MNTYDVCIELGPADECMAHVLDLPGCAVRADSKEQALSDLPGEIRSYHAWLQKHEPGIAETEEPITLRLAEASRGSVPFWRGSKAAMFEPDRVPVTHAEMETYLRRAGYARSDLLALVRDLPNEILDWKAGPEEMSICEILRHIGNAEEWYVSRMVPPASLPSEWAHDGELPIFEFLEMERRTALAQLRQLTEEESAALCYPSHWTDHPEEPWTARKVLRRFVEHEREHITHIRQVLAARCTALGGARETAKQG